MPSLLPGFPQRLVKVLTQTASTFLLVAIFFILLYILNMKFECYCNPDTNLNTGLFMVLPPLILAWLVNITEHIHKRKFFFRWCFQHHKVICNCVWKGIMDYISLGVLWISAVLFDGDWYLCLRTNKNTSQTGIPCRKNLTYEEEKIKAGYKTDSLDIGLGVIIVFVLLWSFGEWIHFCCVRTKDCCGRCCSKLKPKPFYKAVYEDILEEQVRSHLKEKLEEIAKEKAEAICRVHIEKIRGVEMRVNNRQEGDNGDAVDLDTWWKISASDFHAQDEQPDDQPGDQQGNQPGDQQGNQTGDQQGNQPRDQPGDACMARLLNPQENFESNVRQNIPMKNNPSHSEQF